MAKWLGQYLTRHIFAGRATTASDADTHEVVVDENGAMATKLTGSTLRENPSNTEVGQEVVSVAESFYARLAREGRFTGAEVQEADINTSGNWDYKNAFTPSPQCRFYPATAVISANQDALLAIQVNTGVSTAKQLYYIVWAKAGTPVVIPFDGNVFVEEGGAIGFGSKTTASGLKITGTVTGVEVATSV